MKANSLSVTAAGEDDLPEVLSLSTLIQPHLARSLELLRWQYAGSPGKNSALYLGRDPRDGQLIATYGAVSQVLQAGTSRRGAWMIQDVMTHPEHRGQGHLHTLARHCHAQMKRLELVGYTFPNELSYKSFARTGWTRVDLIPSRETGLATPLPGNTRLDPLADSGFAAAADVWNHSGLLLGVARDAAFLSWRYAKPAQSYRLFSDERDYFVALKLFDSPEGRIVHLLDVITRDTARDRLGELLTACLEFGARHGAVRATAWLPPDHVYSGAFEAVGLRLKQRPERFFYVHAPDTVPMPHTFWHLTQGDSDVY